MLRYPSKASTFALLMSISVAVAGCASEQEKGGDPGYRPLAAGQNCADIKSELGKLQSRGVGNKADAASSGRKMSDKDRADVNRYNSLLDQYLGARCHN